MIGISMAKHARSEDSNEWRAATEVRRIYDNRVATLRRHLRRLWWTYEFKSDAYAQIPEKSARERDGMVEQLQRFRENQMPPLG